MIRKEPLAREQCGLLVVDIQERMMRVILEKEEVVKNSVLLLKAANALKLPVVATTQYREKIGQLLPAITAELNGVTPLDKFEFGCFYNEKILSHLQSYSDVGTWIVCGVETHICMYQTVLGGLANGFNMVLPADAVSSRTAKNYDLGLKRIAAVGGAVVSTEMVIYELLGRAGTEEFKSLLPYLK